MALIKCPGCGNDVSDKAERCMQCGYELKISTGTGNLTGDVQSSTMSGSGTLTNSMNYGSGSLASTSSGQGRCAKCGAILSADQDFCPKCGNPRVKNNICGKCGAELQEGQDFCPKCGQKAGLSVDSNVSSAINQFNAGIEKKNKKKNILPIILAIVVIAALVLVVYLKGPSVKEIVLAKDSIEIKVDESESIGYTISPDKASGAKVTWSSSNESVAKVDENGKITGKGDGSCTITVKAGKQSDSLTVTVKSGPDFKAIYDKYCESTWATVGSDGSYLSIDTNPKDKDDYSDYDALAAIFAVNEALGLPDSLGDSMLSTTALMGRQSEQYEKQGVSVSWWYHPDKGMEVSYKAID